VIPFLQLCEITFDYIQNLTCSNDEIHQIIMKLLLLVTFNQYFDQYTVENFINI